MTGAFRSNLSISTHALREEGDVTLGNNFLPVKFLPTPSARRATAKPNDTSFSERISTHALREEGDKT